MRDKDSEFLGYCTNYLQIEKLIENGLSNALAQTDPKISTNPNFEKCYAVLENRLITPDGYVYSCPSIAEHRDSSLALGHIIFIYSFSFCCIL